jgi:hypothetical protein
MDRNYAPEAARIRKRLEQHRNAVTGKGNDCQHTVTERIDDVAADLGIDHDARNRGL